MAVVMSGCISVCPASALTPDQVTEIKAVAATGVLAEIETLAQTTVKDAITGGEKPTIAAEQSTQTAVASAKQAGKDTRAVAKAAKAGAISGAVSAAMATGLDAEAFAEAAMLGSNQGIALVLGNLLESGQIPVLEPEAFTTSPQSVISMPRPSLIPPPTPDDHPASQI